MNTLYSGPGELNAINITSRASKNKPWTYSLEANSYYAVSIAVTGNPSAGYAPATYTFNAGSAATLASSTFNSGGVTDIFGINGGVYILKTSTSTSISATYSIAGKGTAQLACTVIKLTII